MVTYAFKWIAASLVMPLIVLVFSRVNDYFVLTFWPGSIVLMSLGAQEWHISHIIYVWSIAVGLNVILYLSIGMLGYYLCKPSGG